MFENQSMQLTILTEEKRKTIRSSQYGRCIWQYSIVTHDKNSQQSRKRKDLNLIRSFYEKPTSMRSRHSGRLNDGAWSHHSSELETLSSAPREENEEKTKSHGLEREKENCLHLQTTGWGCGKFSGLQKRATESTK